MVKQGVDYLLLAIILALGAISEIVIFAASHQLARNQLIFWIFGISILFFAANLFHQTWQKFSLVFYIASLLALFAVFLIGVQVRGSARWIDLGIFRFQPSEITKVASILMLAAFFSERTAKTIKNLLLSFLIVIPPFVLIFLQPDIGSAVSLPAIWFGIAYASGLQKKHLFSFAIILIIFTTVAFELLAPYQKSRIETFLNPSQDPLGAGYNIIQSQIAVGSGEFFGRGPGRGSQSQLNFLPEAQSDFIFASTTEQLGFLGASLIIILFIFATNRLIGYLNYFDRFGQLVVVGAVFVLLYQFLVNVGMNMGIIPVTGITLPFISYGGSSLISMLLLLGIVFSQKRQF